MRGYEQVGMLRNQRLSMKTEERLEGCSEYLDVPYVERIVNGRAPREDREFQPIHKLDDGRVHVHYRRGWEED